MICSLTGLFGMGCLNVLSKRTISEIWIHQDGQHVDLQYFNAFWNEKRHTMHITEFSNFDNSYMGYDKSDLVNFGKVWINLTKNKYNSIPEYSAIVRKVLKGETLHFDKYFE